MELLGERPVWSLSGGELLSELDTLDAELAQRASRRIEVVARIEETRYAEELGARDAVELLSLRYRRDRAEAWRRTAGPSAPEVHHRRPRTHSWHPNPGRGVRGRRR
jgi:hypothetical protein